MTITVTDTATGQQLTVREVSAALAVPEQQVSAPYSRAVGVATLHEIEQWANATIDRALLGVKRRFYDDLDRIIADGLNGARLPKQWPTVDDLIARRQRQEQTAEWPIQAASVKWAELPEVRDPVPPVMAAIRSRYGPIDGRSPFDTSPAPDETMPGRAAITPTRNPLAEAYAKTAALARQRKASAPDYPDTPEQTAEQEATARALADGQRRAQGWTPDPADYDTWVALDPTPESNLMRLGRGVDWRAEWAEFADDLGRPLRALRAWWRAKQAQRKDT